jgi:large subunit ribosomal protein L25
MEKLIFTPDVYQIEIDVEGTKKKAIIQELQMHPVTEKPMHVDFLELQDGKPVRIGIPIRITGRSKGVLNGGRLQAIFRRLNVEGLPKDLPEVVELDVTPLRIGMSIRIRDIEIPGLKILHADDAVVVSVKMARGAVDVDDEDETEEGAEGAEASDDSENSEG